ncbi:DUF2303 family protein [Devosia sp. YIM 151766]|uniref:DUF2303 family protein n=1 Tax=Devosia sp. YIM 151766 TaxID=3017325 RepID=UPI00255CD9A1|nr:DUF2303 family protein [Devosia sp. YIM 151766]WIY54126.1 DUF2303 family protein [Devosia sp. YIM 151766]
MNETTHVRGDVEVAIDALAEAHVSGAFPTPNGGQVLFVGKGLRTEVIQPLNPVLPARVSQAETVVEPASFIDYIIQFKSPTAICRASLSGNNITAVLDYHGRARESEDGAVPQPLTHTVTLKCPFDLDYAKWRSVFGKGLNQTDFAELLEDMVHTISEPAVADLMEAINDLKIDREVRFKSGRNDRNGTVQITYEEIDAEGTSTGGRVTLPQEVKIVLSVFQGGELVELIAKLRYRMEKGAVAFILVVPGLDKIERDQFRRIGEKVRADTDTPVFYTA